MEDGTEQPVADASDLLKFIPKEPNSRVLLAVAELAIGLNMRPVSVEYPAFHTQESRTHSTWFEPDFYGCAQATSVGRAELARALALRGRVTPIEASVETTAEGYLVRIPCVFWDRDSNVRVIEILIGAQSISLDSSRTWLRFTSDGFIDDEIRLGIER
jgi:hypothetical protein